MMLLSLSFLAFASADLPDSENTAQQEKSNLKNDVDLNNFLKITEENLSHLELDEQVGIVFSVVSPTSSQSQSLGTHFSSSTPFEIGSVSKVFTALALAVQTQSNDLSLETTVGELLPQTPMPENVAQITLKDLATHSSGLSRMPPNLGLFYILRHASDPYAEYSRADLHKALKKTKLSTEPTYEYSNYGFGLLGDLLSTQSNMSYCELIETKISMPLNLTNTQCSKISKHTAQPHLHTGQENPVWNFDSLAGAGALRSTADDLSTFLQFAMNPDNSPQGLAMQLTLKEEHSTLKTMGLGWHLHEQPNRCWYHNGMTGGSSSFIGFCPDAQTGIVILMNQSDPKFRLTQSGLQSLEALESSGAQ